MGQTDILFSLSVTKEQFYIQKSIVIARPTQKKKSGITSEKKGF